MTRPTRDETYLAMAKVLSERRTCWRRAVGCLLVDADGNILAQGYNGPASGERHCNEQHGFVYQDGVIGDMEFSNYPNKCPGSEGPSGTNLDACQAIHAEANAILRLKDYRAVHTAYVTASPCVPCVKLLRGTSCQRIVFAEEYPHPQARVIWEKAGREWIHLKLT